MRGFMMLNFLTGLGKDKTGGATSNTSAPPDDFELEEFEIELAVAPEIDQMHRSLFKTEVENLMSSVRQQSVELSCQFASFANWSSEIEMLSARAATLEPILTKLVEENCLQATALADHAHSKEAAEHRLYELESEVGHYRPLAARYEEELRAAREKYSSAQNMLASLEGQFAQRQSESNELMYELARAESKATRAGEENIAFRQKAQEHNAVIQSQIREIADLKSAISTTTRALQKQEELVADLTARLASALETGNQSAATLTGVLMRDAQIEKDLQMRLADAAEQQQEMAQKLAIRDKQLSAAEMKISGLNSKVEFLTQLTQKLRDDLRGNIDHTNMVEISNRQLLDSMPKRGLHDDRSSAGAETAKDARPKLRPVQMSNSSRAQGHGTNA
jgi:DNA repair exonuclease SbcCD ATPase subunit